MLQHKNQKNYWKSFVQSKLKIFLIKLIAILYAYGVFYNGSFFMEFKSVIKLYTLSVRNIYEWLYVLVYVDRNSSTMHILILIFSQMSLKRLR